MKCFLILLSLASLILASPGPAEDGLEKPLPPSCSCINEIPICPPSEPANCECKNDFWKKCWLKAAEGGVKCPTPKYVNCKALTQRDPHPPEGPRPSCKCRRHECPPFEPLKCRCEHMQDIRCWLKCGGPKPELKKCPPFHPGPPHNETRAHLARDVEPQRGPLPFVFPPCDKNSKCPTELPNCVADPRKTGSNICIGNQKCGGLEGKTCPVGSKCVDDPRDLCSSDMAADCMGTCVPGKFAT